MEQTVINYQRIKAAIEYLHAHELEQPSLEEVAAQVHLSPYHFQRLFTEWAGVSPKRFLQYLTIQHLKQQLQRSESLFDIAADSGLSSQSRIHDLFVTIESMTPQTYRSGGAELVIYYGYHTTPFGHSFIGATDRGVCHLEFLDVPDSEVERLAQKWPNARLEERPDYTNAYIDKIFRRSASERPAKLHLLVRGTNFQIKVWEALLRIPVGAVATYAQIGRAIGQPRAARAVGSAVGNNPIAYLIPCHRVIRKEGRIGQYRWGSVQKSALVGWEMAAMAMPAD